MTNYGYLLAWCTCENPKTMRGKLEQHWCAFDEKDEAEARLAELQRATDFVSAWLARIEDYTYYGEPTGVFTTRRQPSEAVT